MVGSFPVALAWVLKAAGFLGQAEATLSHGYTARGFGDFSGAVQPWWELLVVAGLVYALVWLLFETPGAERRVLLTLTATVMVLSMSPVLALWGIFWCPLAAVIGMAWGGFCAILWARQNPMPCELPDEKIEDRSQEELQEGKIIPMKPEAGSVPDEQEAEARVAETDKALEGGSGRKRGRRRGTARRSRRK